MEYLNNEKVEEIAAELFRSYKEKLDANWDVLCVEPLILAEMLGYEVTLLEFGEDSEILGLTVFRDMDVNLTDKFGKSHRLHLNKKSIVINKSLKESSFGRYLVIGPFANEKITYNVKTYISTKFFRFLVLLYKNTQHATQSVYKLVPIQDFSKTWTDEELYKKYNLTQDEIDYIESMIKPMPLTIDSEDWAE